jgi:HPt (histidine-containing phosphotransfer) domain-containing protein
MTLNDEALFQSVITQFLEETSEDTKTMSTALPDRDTKVIREIVHRLSGRLSQIGIADLGSQFSRIETMIVSGSAYEEFEDALADALDELEKLLTRLRLTTLEHLN